MKAMVAGFVVSFIVQLTLVAQEVPTMPAPQEEHAWLKQFAGEWQVTSEATLEPGKPPVKCTGSIDARMLGGFWVVLEMKNEMMGMTMSAIQTIGYDPLSKKYVGTFIDSTQGYMWKYQGSVDPTGKILTLEAEGPNFMLAGKMTRFHDVYEFKSHDHMFMSSSVQGDDGKWVTFMTGDGKRKK